MVRIKGKPNISSSLEEKTVLWRYIDMAKFLDIVINRSLFFCRSDNLSDKHEGRFTKELSEKIEKAYTDNKITYSSDKFKKKLRERVFLNCWHASEDESMAMWKIYGGHSDTVAITTTVGKLRDAFGWKLPYYILISKVEYVNHWDDPKLIINPYSNIFAYKLKAYKFEEEVRVIVDRLDEEFDSEKFETGIHVQLSLKTLLRSIVISPMASGWFIPLVENVALKYGITAPVEKSKLTLESRGNA